MVKGTPNGVPLLSNVTAKLKNKMEKQTVKVTKYHEVVEQLEVELPLYTKNTSDISVTYTTYAHMDEEQNLILICETLHDNVTQYTIARCEKGHVGSDDIFLESRKCDKEEFDNVRERALACLTGTKIVPIGTKTESILDENFKSKLLYPVGDLYIHFPVYDKQAEKWFPCKILEDGTLDRANINATDACDTANGARHKCFQLNDQFVKASEQRSEQLEGQSANHEDTWDMDKVERFMTEQLSRPSI